MGYYSGMATPGLAGLGKLLHQKRTGEGLTLQGLGAMLKERDQQVACSAAHLSQVENGRSWPSPQLVDCLDEVFDCGQEFRTLLRIAKVPTTTASAKYSLTAHLIKPVYVGLEHDPVDLEPIDGSHRHVSPGNSYRVNENTDLHLFGFGVAVAHERHELTFSHIAELAVWRSQTFQECLTTRNTLELLTGVDRSELYRAETAYVLSTFVLDEPAWNPGDQLNAAIRLLSSPSVVLKAPKAKSEYPADIHFTDEDIAFEESLLVSDYPIVDGVDFGIDPLSCGFASWAGVAYYPCNKDRALDPDYLTDFEIQMQAVWCIANAMASGVAPGGYDEAQGIRSLVRRLSQIGANEGHQYLRMREALIETSRVKEVARDAVDYLLVSAAG